MARLPKSEGKVKATGTVRIYRKDGSVEEIQLDDISVEEIKPWYRRIR